MITLYCISSIIRKHTRSRHVDEQSDSWVKFSALGGIIMWGTEVVPIAIFPALIFVGVKE